MPYIPERFSIDEDLDELLKRDFSVGELNYIITKLCHEYLLQKGVKYSNINDLIGVLECAKLELYRMIAAPYEDIKRKENGNISRLDGDK